MISLGLSASLSWLLSWAAAALSAPAKTIVSIVSIFVSSFMCVLGVGYIVEIVICYVPGVSKCRR